MEGALHPREHAHLHCVGCVGSEQAEPVLFVPDPLGQGLGEGPWLLAGGPGQGEGGVQGQGLRWPGPHGAVHGDTVGLHLNGCQQEVGPAQTRGGWTEWGLVGVET